MSKDIDKQGSPESFSLSAGGPLYRLFIRLGLVKKPLLLYKRRIVVVTLLTWLPLLVLAILGGVFLGGEKVPFVQDLDVHVRFLVALPMLIYAEVIAHNRMQTLVEQFPERDLIATGDRMKFNGILASVMRLRDSVLAELVLIVLVYTVGYWLSQKFLPLGASSWLVTSENEGSKLTAAGWWYVFISLPIFQFILLRWYWHIAIWYRFLWQISRLRLQLNSLHPDRAGGLGFLENSIYALEPFLLAHSVLLSGMIFNRILNTGASLYDFKIEMISVLIFVLIIPLMPLLFFSFQQIKEKRLGTLNYGVVANRYVNDFREKWIALPSQTKTSMLGSSDVQSLADLFNSFEVSNKMRITPFGKSSMMALVTLTVLPLLPLVLTMIPLEKIMHQILGLIF